MNSCYLVRLVCISTNNVKRPTTGVRLMISKGTQMGPVYRIIKGRLVLHSSPLFSGTTSRRFVRLHSPNIQSFCNIFSEVNYDIPIYMYFVCFKWSIPSFTKFYCVFTFLFQNFLSKLVIIGTLFCVLFSDFHQHLFVVCFIFVVNQSSMVYLITYLCEMQVLQESIL